MYKIKDSLVEKNARQRAAALLDSGTFKELLDPFEFFESPHLLKQDIVPQSDDGVTIAKGLFNGSEVLFLSIEGAFQGGGIGEVSGAKISGALELALKDNENGRKTPVVFIMDSGGVRLQEANYGLMAISEIQAAVIALRKYVPVIGIIPGKVGCFGGMAMTAGLFSELIMTKEGRLTLNGPEVIEQEAGLAELDSSDKRLIWGMIGGVQRQAAGFADTVAADDLDEIRIAIQKALDKKDSSYRSRQPSLYRKFIASIDPSHNPAPEDIRRIWTSKDFRDAPVKGKENPESGSVLPESRGRTWFSALTGITEWESGDVPSVLYGDADLGGERVLCITVVPNPYAPFPRARKGQVGLEEGWKIAECINKVVGQDGRMEKKRPIVAIVDVPGQAYGYKEELLGISQACAGAVDAYATARLEGHPVVSLLVGPAISGAFLAHGYQANRILALSDPNVQVHAMSRESAARITRRSIRELEEASAAVPGIAYDIKSYYSLGALDELIEGIPADHPGDVDIQRVQRHLCDNIADIRRSSRDLSHRLNNARAKTGRKMTIAVKERLKSLW